MKLEDFLFLIQDEEVRIELEIDDEEDYQYHHFWLSDFRSNLDIAKHYRDYDVSSFSFEPEEERNAQIRIYIKQKLIIPKFKVGDRVRYKGHVCDGVVTEITDTDYICGNAKLPISTQDKLELIEQKPTDKVEPKFKVGDWLVHNERKHVIKVVNPTPMVYEVVNILGYHHTITDTAIENNYHLWTIRDAKDGDVLWHSDTASHGTFIFKQIRYDGKVLCYCDYDSEDHFCTGEHHTCCWSSDKCIKPATKEQRELLFQKMHEAGYEWDFNKKDLKKINSYCQENFILN